MAPADDCGVDVIDGEGKVPEGENIMVAYISFS